MASGFGVCRILQEVFVLGEEDPSQFRSPIQHDRVGLAFEAILLDRPYVYVALAQGTDHQPIGTLLGAEPNHRRSLPSARSRAATGLGPAAARSFFTSSSPSRSSARISAAWS